MAGAAPGHVPLLELANTLGATALATRALLAEGGPPPADPRRWGPAARGWLAGGRLRGPLLLAWAGANAAASAGLAPGALLHAVEAPLRLLHAALAAFVGDYLANAVVVAWAMALLCYVEARKASGGAPLAPRRFIRMAGLAVGDALLAAPAALVLVAFAFLALDAVLERLGLPTAWLNGPIYYGVLYGPPCTSYYFCSRRAARATSLIPL